MVSTLRLVNSVIGLAIPAYRTIKMLRKPLKADLVSDVKEFCNFRTCNILLSSRDYSFMNFHKRLISLVEEKLTILLFFSILTFLLWSIYVGFLYFCPSSAYPYLQALRFWAQSC